MAKGGVINGPTQAKSGLEWATASQDSKTSHSTSPKEGIAAIAAAIAVL